MLRDKSRFTRILQVRICCTSGFRPTVRIKNEGCAIGVAAPTFSHRVFFAANISIFLRYVEGADVTRKYKMRTFVLLLCIGVYNLLLVVLKVAGITFGRR